MDLSKFQKNNKFLMLALDHRGSFKKMMNPQNPDSVSDEQIIQLKNDIIESLKDQFSALLIDETWGLEACHEVCQIKPFLLPLEKSGHTEVAELEYSVGQIKDMGASGAKLLLYFDPESENAKKQIEVARGVMNDCQQNNFPFFLEIVNYVSNPGLSSQNQSGIVGSSVNKFINEGVKPDVWKLEYPGSAEECQKLTNLVDDVPWILLTGGQTFEEFKPELEIASKNGCQGFLAGRALWQEVCQLQGSEKEKFLNATLPERFRIISQIMLP